MNTPSHYIINLTLLGSTVGNNENIAITLGAILPDLPIFMFYFITKVIYKMPEKQIWSEEYYQPFWQNIVSLSHSFPFAVVGLLICLFFNWKSGIILFFSIILHFCCDFPFHNDDAHRHFFPISDYRFISPLSYWDVRYYGNIVALGEIILVMLLTPITFQLLDFNWSKTIIIIINFIYIYSYLRFYILRS